MTSRMLILLYDLTTQRYIQKLPHESEISWCLKWQDAKDFSDLFFVTRLFLRLKLNYKFKLNLVYKKILIFENVRGCV